MLKEIAYQKAIQLHKAKLNVMRDENVMDDVRLNKIAEAKGL